MMFSCMNDNCSKDQGLCLYSCCCAVCVHAEVAAKNDVEGLFGTKDYCSQIAAAVGTYCLTATICNICCGLGGLFAPCICTAYFTQVRDGVKRKYGLPNDEFIGDLTMSSYLPTSGAARMPRRASRGKTDGLLRYGIPFLCFPECTPCAAYQMAYFMKYESPIKSDFECFVYTALCKK